MRNHLFLTLVASLCLGIVLQNFVSLSNNWIWFVIGFVLFLTFLCYVFFTKQLQICLIVLFVLVGWIRADSTQNIALHSDFYNNKHWLKLEIVAQAGQSNQYYKYIAKIKANNSTWSFITPNLLIYVNKKIGKQYLIGDCMWVNEKVHKAQGATNPHQFNYANYLQNKGIIGVIYANQSPIYGGFTLSFGRKTDEFKQKINQKLQQNRANQSSVSLINALILGNRTELSKNQKESFAKAGVMHLLAISGLHIGILFSLFWVLLYPIQLLPNGKKLRILLALLLIWFFAAFVNFSASVSRAALMLSLYYLSVLLNKQSNVLYTLALSAFVLLYYNPKFIFDVGFQLSYSAVFFIVWLFPIVRQFLHTKQKGFIWLRDLLGISLVAQLGTMPLSVFYFHRFSALFLLGNLVLIPTAYLLISGGIVIVILIGLNVNFVEFMHIYNWLSHWVFECIFWLSKQSDFIFSRLYVSKFQVVLFCIALLLVGFWFKKQQKFKIGLGLLLVVLLLQSIRAFQIHKSNHDNQLIAFDANKDILIGLKEGNQLRLFASKPQDSAQYFAYFLQNFMAKEHIKTTLWFDLDSEYKSDLCSKTKNIFALNNKLLIISEKGIPIQNKSTWFYDGRTVFLPCGNANQKITLQNEYVNDSCNWRIQEKGAFMISF